ncbi:MAG: TolC family protein [Planctomycetaceae bacterium]|jgi:outer membrane protein TolC
MLSKPQANSTMKPTQRLAQRLTRGLVHSLKGWLPLALGLTAPLLGVGCSRQKWHNQADDVAYAIVGERYTDPRWTNPRADVIADPRSRFYDPNDPDCSPLPPDDPSAHTYMHSVYGIKGYKHWHDFGDLDAIENPNWLEPFGLPAQTVSDNFQHYGTYPELNDVTLGDALELAYLHSREYQTQVENVFLTALAVSFERFRFQVQFVGLTATTPIGISNGNKPGFGTTGTDIPGLTDAVNFGPAAGATQLTPWGSQWLVGLANNTLWFWSDGSATDATSSTLSYSLVQPLLAGAGKRVVLENLTQSERHMLYAVRDFARFRMGFFTTVVTGGQTAGITGVGQPGVGTGVSVLGGGGVAGVQGGAGGYLGLLQQIQVISNQEFNIRLLLSNLEKTRARVSQPRRPYEVLEEVPEGFAIPDELAGSVFLRREQVLDENGQPILDTDGKPALEPRLYVVDRLTEEQRMQLLGLSDRPAWAGVVRRLTEQAGQQTRNQQVAQLETQLATLYNQLRQNKTNFQNNLDQYKLTLGLPTSLPMSLNRELLKPFELVDPKLQRLIDRLNAFVPEPPAEFDAHPDTIAMERVNRLMRDFDPVDPSPEVLQGLVVELFALRDDLAKDGLETLRENYRAAVEHFDSSGQSTESDPGLERYNSEKFRELTDRQEEEFDLLADRLQRLRNRVVTPGLDVDERRRLAGEINDLREDLITLAQGLTGVEANLRMELIDLNPFEMPLESAVELGLANRLDLKNVQGVVMDARRKVEVAANQLQAVLNITAAGDIRTQTLGSGNDNPFEFRGDESNIRLGVQFTTPIQLVQQRNTYRASLIGYQQARRNYMRVEDQVKLDVRTAWRNLELLRLNFETAKANVRAAVIQYDIASEQASAPGGVVPAGGGGGGGANQGLNILNALNSLLQAQNQLIQTWVTYEQNRLGIYNSMGILDLDDAGVWTDEFYQQQARPLGSQPRFSVTPYAGPNQALLPNPGLLTDPQNPLLPPGIPGADTQNLPPLPSEDLNNALPPRLNNGAPQPGAKRRPGREKKIQYAAVGRGDVITVRGSSQDGGDTAGTARTGGRGLLRLQPGAGR